MCKQKLLILIQSNLIIAILLNKNPQKPTVSIILLICIWSADISLHDKKHADKILPIYANILTIKIIVCSLHERQS